MMGENKLNHKRWLFVEEYLKDLNAAAAARRAGYSEKTARSMGQQLLTNIDIQAQLQKRMKERAEATEITQERVIKEIAAVAFANGTDYAQVAEGPGGVAVGIVPTDQLTPKQRAAVAGIKQTQNGIEIKLSDKMKALELLGTLGALTVVSVAGATSGQTMIYVNPSKGAGNSYKYKTSASVALPSAGDILTTGWTAWDGSAAITATTGNQIVIVEVVTATNAAVNAGTATVTAKA